VLDEISERQAVFQPYAGVFALVQRQRFEAPALKRIQAALAASHLNADEQMRRIGHIMQFGDLRLSLIFPAIQALLLWNFHTLWLLERWQRSSGPLVRQWLETLSELEALAALAALAHDNPDWPFPEIVEHQPPLVGAQALGHPLLPPDVRVGNDVTIGPPGGFLLVTGSNMSGKSTLLRAVGVNVTLAQMGAPVCAHAMRLPPVALATSVRVSDSLEYGVSYFMAELRRLKQVVDVAEDAARGDERTALFLLDEILHGTNTTERQIAVRYIIRHLLALGAIGAVSTHDLTLAQLPEIAAVSHPVHFTEDFVRTPQGPQMRFDYALREGIATSTNALKLMEIAGLPVDDDDIAGT
jgi:DNA mismatch repair ATPase MutS